MVKCTWAEWKQANWLAMQERDARQEAERRAAKVVDLKAERKRQRRLQHMAKIKAIVERRDAEMRAFLATPEGQRWLDGLDRLDEPTAE
jgi:hypothetical protein